jgi:hypothetical protein
VAQNDLDSNADNENCKEADKEGATTRNPCGHRFLNTGLPMEGLGRQDLLSRFEIPHQLFKEL